MRISLNWIKKYVSVPESVSDEALIRLIGARLVEVEGVIDETHKYDNIYIVRVESCEKIPETHLTLCQINCGESESVQVVCGAPNVRAGMFAVWIAPGAIVPASVHEDAPFVIGKRKMQGYESNGMLAGADELDFGDDHSGIVEIGPGTAKPGDLLADAFELKDKILEIENKSLTHRPDCFGVIGFAREVAGILGVNFANPVLSSAGLKFLNTSYAKSDIVISIADSDICQRYSAIAMEKHGEVEKKYLSSVDVILSKSGMRPVEPIVDATNYLMLLTGQPLHAFDYDKFITVGKTGELEIKVRLARRGEKLVLLDDSEIELNENDIVICSGDTPVALAGAMGGKSTMIDEGTRNIIIESATFSLYNLRKTQMAHGIFSEAITRFTKGQSPYQTMVVAEACAEMLADGFRVVKNGDSYPKPIVKNQVVVSVDDINGLLGSEYSKELIMTTLQNVGFKVKEKKSLLEVEVPEWRTDIHIKEDIIEEVGRLLGYDNIEPTLPLHGTAQKNEMLELRRRIRSLMLRLGANEVLTYSFVSGKLLERVGQDLSNSYKIINSISPDLQYVKQSLIPSLLEKTYLNEKLPVEKFAIYEMNKVYQKAWGMDNEDVPAEKMHLGCVIAERKNTTETAFYKAKKYVAKLLDELNVVVDYLPMEDLDSAEAKPFEKKRTAEIWLNGTCIGRVGEFRNSVKSDFKLASFVAGFEIDLGEILKFASHKRRIDLVKYEKRDLTVTTKEETYGELICRIQDVLDKNGAKALITPRVIYQSEGEQDKNISVHLDFSVFNEDAMTALENL